MNHRHDLHFVVCQFVETLVQIGFLVRHFSKRLLAGLNPLLVGLDFLLFCLNRLLVCLSRLLVCLDPRLICFNLLLGRLELLLGWVQPRLNCLSGLQIPLTEFDARRIYLPLIIAHTMDLDFETGDEGCHRHVLSPD